jgi:hypothetical protein
MKITLQTEQAMDSDESVGLGRDSGSGKDFILRDSICSAGFILYHRITNGIAAESNNKQFLLEES